MAAALDELRGYATLTHAGLKFMASGAKIHPGGLEKGELISALQLAKLLSLSRAELQTLAAVLAVDAAGATQDQLIAIVSRALDDRAAPAMHNYTPSITPQFEVGDRVFRKGAACKILSIDVSGETCQIQVEQDGQIVDTLVSLLSPMRPMTQACSRDAHQDIFTQKFDFQIGDRALRKGEPCKVIAMDSASQSCEVEMDSDGRIVCTLLAMLKPAAQAYPASIHEDGCPICLRPVLGENCVPCCDKCQESKYLHRHCFLGMASHNRCACPLGHQLKEMEGAKRALAAPFVCRNCNNSSQEHEIWWHCQECDWGLCRLCIEGTLSPDVRCPTCRAPLPFTRHLRNRTGKGPLVLDECGVHHVSLPATGVDRSLDCLFQRRISSRF